MGNDQNIDSYKCPVCGKHTFEHLADFETCPVCGWINDGWYERGGANVKSLEACKREYLSEVAN